MTQPPSQSQPLSSYFAQPFTTGFTLTPSSGLSFGVTTVAKTHQTMSPSVTLQTTPDGNVTFIYPPQTSVTSSETESLRRENARLKTESEQLRRTIQALIDEKAQIHGQKESLLQQVQDLSSDQSKLRSEHEHILQENDRLKEENIRLHQMITEQQLKISQLQLEVHKLQKEVLIIPQLEKNVGILLARDEPITLREVLRATEEHVLLKQLGSKKKARKAKNRKAEMTKYFTSVGLEKPHQQWFRYLKDNGDVITHAGRPKVTIEDVKDLMQRECKEEQIVNKLCANIATVLKTDVDGYLDTTSPLKRQKPKPVKPSK